MKNFIRNKFNSNGLAGSQGIGYLHLRKPRSYVTIVSTTLLIYFSLIGLWSFLYNLFISFWKINISASNIFEKFVGFSYYINVFKSEIFRLAILHNIIYIVVLVTVGISTSLIIAALLYNTSGFLRKLFIAMYFAPVVTSMTAVALVWKLIYYPKVGILSVIISTLFRVGPQGFLNNPKLALLSIIVMDIWRDTGLRVAILLSGIEEIPKTYYEAAKIDGASPIKQFFKITLPLLKPQIFFLIVIYSINAIEAFTQIYMMTRTGQNVGGPANSTQVLSLHMYQKTFAGQSFGYGAVVGLVIFTLLLIFVLTQIKLFRSEEQL